VGAVLRVSGRLGVEVLAPWAQKIADAPLDQMPPIRWGGARGQCHHRAPPSRQCSLGSVPSVVPPKDADAGDVRAFYPATATCLGPRQDPARHHVPSAPRLNRRHNGKLRYCKHITFIWIFIITLYLILWVAQCACWDRAARIVREGVVLYLGASAAPEHVRQDCRGCHEVLRRCELHRGRKDLSPSTSPSVVLELRLDSGFTADTSHLCRWLLGSDGTAAATGAGLTHLRAATVCPLTPRRRYS
jgi:hypothetical protein